VRVGVFRAGALPVSLSMFILLLAAAGGHAQAPPSQTPPPQAPQPVTGFVPPYEIMRTVRSAGFDPLAPPLREGTTYVLRATDFRGILMRVVLDARTGAIRDVNRIVPGTSGQIGMVPPPYGAPPRYGSPPYEPPPEFNAPAPGEESAAPPLSQPPAARTATHPAVSAPPPLPRPRPAALASRKPADTANSAAKAEPKIGASTGAETGANSGDASDAKPEIKSDATTAAPAASPAVPSKVPAVVPLND